MFYTPFLYEMNQLRIGIRTNVRPSATMTLCFRSPHASCKTDNWLGGKLLRLYTAYYRKVMWDTDTGKQEKDLYNT